MSNIIKLDFEGHAVRQIETEVGTEWVAKDVCEVLELTNSRMALGALDDDEKGVRIVDTHGGPQEMATVTEAGLYALIGRSRKPSAKRFRRWVNHEVLPSIRKTGGYVAPGHEEAFTIRLLGMLEAQGKTIGALASQVQALTEWRTEREREHPYGLLGKRDAKALRGMFIAIRDKHIQLGADGTKLTIYRRVDDAVRKEVGYRNEKGAAWESATRAQGTAAFAAASRMVASLDRDIARRKSARKKSNNQLDLVK